MSDDEWSDDNNDDEEDGWGNDKDDWGIILFECHVNRVLTR